MLYEKCFISKASQEAICLKRIKEVGGMPNS